jgi:GMC oxidoreductase
LYSPAAVSGARPQVIVVGAGLGGCLAAHRLADFAEVTLIEQGPSDGVPLVDHDVPVGIAPYAGSGLGGATRFWANGLIQVPERAFRDWPLSAETLDPWLEDAHCLLGGRSRAAVRADADSLTEFVEQIGIPPSLLGPPLYYPARTQNVWESLGLARRVTAVCGYVDELNLDPTGKLTSVGARTVDGRVRLEADVVILAAGGLGTPGLLQLLADRADGAIAAQAGHHYDDHPSAFVAEFTAPAELARMFADDAPATGGSVRPPLVVDTPECTCAFYLRTASGLRLGRWQAHYREAKGRLSERPWSPGSYAQLIARSGDVLGLAANRAGLGRQPTRFSLLLIAGVPPSPLSRVWRENPLGPVHRRWHIEPQHREELRQATSSVLSSLEDVIDDIEIYSGWDERLESAAHHSGTARLARTPAEGVCDTDGRVFEVPNLYVGDGALIPGSGYANTGLTLGALALRLADHLRETLR